jgi:hypothetical protein
MGDIFIEIRTKEMNELEHINLEEELARLRG